ncbi:winged helix-turn-helix transcriptional regulator [Alkalicella caledoniensis]|uniref:Winged helix-turn-helix transcriptional regulator n=1 Tax=Alkalicella caledoniensis TaxID=2731377 RepID=A0A7G9WCU4_ALKCA|nr:winged helix-turn-helix domain-containing protein [Alkalicella caledoniensis]QNO16506.1 winged helix-turn-helix transcriptional regulator [Alkalicella caledoniensis]
MTNFLLQRDNKTPLYIQVKDNIRRLISEGIWKHGMKIPTERELSKELNVSRNTISVAFQELETEGILVCQQGRGTFVAEADEALKKESRKERLVKVVDICLDEGLSLGFSMDEILAIMYVRAREKKEILNSVKVFFIECNKEQMDYIAKQLSTNLSILVEPLNLDEIYENPNQFLILAEKADIIVTTFFHYNQVKSIPGFENRDIIPIALSPHLETIVKIARFPAEEKVALVCQSEIFANKIKSSLQSAGINHLQIDQFLTESVLDSTLEKDLPNYKYFITSPGKRMKLTKLLGSFHNKEIIEFVFQPDLASINLLKSSLLELKTKKTK